MLSVVVWIVRSWCVVNRLSDVGRRSLRSSSNDFRMIVVPRTSNKFGGDLSFPVFRQKLKSLLFDVCMLSTPLIEFFWAAFIIIIGLRTYSSVMCPVRLHRRTPHSINAILWRLTPGNDFGEALWLMASVVCLTRNWEIARSTSMHSVYRCTQARREPVWGPGKLRSRGPRPLSPSAGCLAPNQTSFVVSGFSEILKFI